MPVSGAKERIQNAVLRWTGVTAHPHRFGGIEFRLWKRELGHLHSNHLLDIPFPMKVRDELVTSGRVKSHHVLPNSGWVSFYIKETSDIDRAIDLLRHSFDLAVEQKIPSESTKK